MSGVNRAKESIGFFATKLADDDPVGAHAAIVEASLFTQVAAILDQNGIDHANAVHADQPSLLSGLVWDGAGRRMSPEHTTKRGGIRYRYYVSVKAGGATKAKAARVPAGDLEALVVAALRRDGLLQESADRASIASMLRQVIIHHDRVELHGQDTAPPVVIHACLIRRGMETRLVEPACDLVAPKPDPALIKLIVNAYRARAALFSGKHGSVRDAAEALGYDRDYYAVLLRLSYLAPDIVAAILDGRQPPRLNRQRLARVSGLPVDWQAQRDMLGFA